MIGGNTGDTASKLVLPTVVSGTTLLGISWENWVLILTALYTLLQIGDWVYGKLKLWKERKRVHA